MVPAHTTGFAPNEMVGKGLTVMKVTTDVLQVGSNGVGFSIAYTCQLPVAGKIKLVVAVVPPAVRLPFGTVAITVP